jgi:membrane-bound ClpP family serine protease
MIRNRRVRRTSAIIMMVLGAVMMFLAPGVWQGAVLFVLGMILELLGIALERNNKKSS